MNLFRIMRLPSKFYLEYKRASRKHERHKKIETSINNNINKVIIVVGAESTATRFLTGLLSKSTDIIGEKEPKKHWDYFDEIWELIERKNYDRIKSIFPKNNKHYVTRRSFPHALYPGDPAFPYEFPPLGEFIRICKQNGFQPILLITTRSPLPNLISWKTQRSSAENSMLTAFNQYQSTYRYIFHVIQQTDTPYLIISQEALMYEKAAYLNSILHLIDIGPISIEDELFNEDANMKYYNFK